MPQIIEGIPSIDEHSEKVSSDIGVTAGSLLIYVLDEALALFGQNCVVGRSRLRVQCRQDNQRSRAVFRRRVYFQSIQIEHNLEGSTGQLGSECKVEHS
jgi:hypothetical protein